MLRLQQILFNCHWAYRSIRIGMGGLFVWAGAGKLMAPRAFARVIAEYGIIPEPMLPFVAVGLPALEALAGLGLVFDVRGSLKVVCGLLALFLAVLAFAVLNDLDVDCGCFSQEDLLVKSSVKMAFMRDLIMMGAVFYLSLWKRFQLRPAIEKSDM